MPSVAQSKFSTLAVSTERAVLLKALVIAAAVLWIYWPALHGGWLWDDDIYVTNNPLLNDPARWWKIWFKVGSVPVYYPITFSVHRLEWLLWHDDTLGYHLTNIGLHIVGSLLVWRLFGKLGLSAAWLGGLIFAVHPVQVESVAWIAELKNGLSLVPFLLAAGAWIDFDARSNARDYWLSWGLFLVAMLCKTTVIMFPVVILLFVWWKRGRIGRMDLLQSVPFFAVSLVLGFMTLLSEKLYAKDATVPLGAALSRMTSAGLAYVFYFSKSMLPVGLLTVYPKWSVSPPTLPDLVPWLTLLILLAFFWIKRRTWGRHALLGIGFFLVMLFPFVGFFSSGFFAFTWVMDHFLYVPIIGFIGIAVAAVGSIEQRIGAPARPVLLGLLTVIVALLTFLARGQAALYTDEVSLWAHTVESNPSSWIAQADLGKAYLAMKQPGKAVEHLSEALQLQSNLPGARLNLGTALVQSGRIPEGLDQLNLALKADSNNPLIYNQQGIALAQTGRISEAIERFQQAVRLRPDYVLAYDNWGLVLAKNGRISDAIKLLDQALAIDPHDNMARDLLAQLNPMQNGRRNPN